MTRPLRGSKTTAAISGNPINWYNDTVYANLTWQNGRQLASLQNGSNTYTYTYDMNGVRSSKTVNGVKHNYITQNGKVVREEYGTTVLEFVYDTNGAPYALRYSTNSGASWMTYYYVLNQQGDVVKLIYTDGAVRAEYSYNAWGEIFSATNPSSSTVNIQDINPLRYRGYYYDTETGWYYLQSRYYDPVVKRFINADEYASTGQGIIGHNMFAYCDNSPARFSDDGGQRPAYATMETDTGSECVLPPTPIQIRGGNSCNHFINKYTYSSNGNSSMYSRDLDKQVGSNYNTNNQRTNVQVTRMNEPYKPRSNSEIIAEKVFEVQAGFTVSLVVDMFFSKYTIPISFGIAVIELIPLQSNPSECCTVYRVRYSTTYYYHATQYCPASTATAYKDLYYGIGYESDNIYKLSGY